MASVFGQQGDTISTMQEGNWQYRPEDTQLPTESKERAADSVSWTASEFVANQKTGGWFVLLAVAALVGCTAIYFLTRDIISAIMIATVAAAFGFLATRQPRILTYKIDTTGIHIGGKFYPYQTFKSFSVVDEGALSSILLMPLKRFMPPISVYYAPEDEDKITDVLGDFLPFEARQHDMVDRFMRKIRF